MHNRISTLLVCLTTAAFFAATYRTQSQTLVEAGMPALSRAWSGKDYERAAEVISSGKVPLPILTDAEGRAFLKRITSTENFSFALDTNLPIAVRLDDFSGSFMTGSKTIFMQYFKAANKGANVHTETAMQLSFMLRVAEVGIKLTDEFIPTIPKDDKYEIRLDGLKRMHSGMTTVFVGVEASLSETSFYSPEDLSLLLQTMAEVLPSIKKAFPGGYEIELRNKLKARRAAFPNEKDATNLRKMIEEIDS